MIELRILKTCAHAMTGPRAGYSQYETERKAFPDIKTARAWLREEYGNARRMPMFRDNPAGPYVEAQKVGYVIGFRCKYRNPGDAVAERHWIEFTEVKTLSL